MHRNETTRGRARNSQWPPAVAGCHWLRLSKTAMVLAATILHLAASRAADTFRWGPMPANIGANFAFPAELQALTGNQAVRPGVRGRGENSGRSRIRPRQDWSSAN